MDGPSSPLRGPLQGKLEIFTYHNALITITDAYTSYTMIALYQATSCPHGILRPSHSPTIPSPQSASICGEKSDFVATSPAIAHAVILAIQADAHGHVVAKRVTSSQQGQEAGGGPSRTLPLAFFMPFILQAPIMITMNVSIIYI